jgi:DNA-binding ferritin-like protein
MEHLISLLFLARDLAHREHLRTKSFAQHMALNTFYNEIVENADAIAEAYQGQYGLMSNIEILGFKSSRQSIITELQTQVKWIKDNRYKICDKDDTPIQNLIDTAVETYLSTLYKLRFLN